MNGHGVPSAGMTQGAPREPLPVVTPAMPPATPSARLLATLGGAGALAGLLIVLAFQWTLPRIEANKAQRLQAAIGEVLAAPARYDTLYLVNGALTQRPPADTRGVERVFLGYTDAGARVGFAISAAATGFQDVISIIFGYDPASGRVIGMKVLGSKETPGLGDKIEKDSGFVRQFRGAETPLAGVKAGSADDRGEVDMITGATISSRAVIRIINDAVTRWRPLLEAYRAGAT